MPNSILDGLPLGLVGAVLSNVSMQSVRAPSTIHAHDYDTRGVTGLRFLLLYPRLSDTSIYCAKNSVSTPPNILSAFSIVSSVPANVARKKLSACEL